MANLDDVLDVYDFEHIKAINLYLTTHRFPVDLDIPDDTVIDHGWVFRMHKKVFDAWFKHLQALEEMHKAEE